MKQKPRRYLVGHPELTSVLAAEYFYPNLDKFQGTGRYADLMTKREALDGVAGWPKNEYVIYELVPVGPKPGKAGDAE